LMAEIEAVSPDLDRARVGWEPKLHEGRGILVGTCPRHTDGARDLHAGIGDDDVPFVWCKHSTCEAVNGLVNAALRQRFRGRGQIAPTADASQRAASNGAAQPRQSSVADDDDSIPILLKPWPAPPDRRVYHGLMGDIVEAVEPHSEADPLALLAQG